MNPTRPGARPGPLDRPRVGLSAQPPTAPGCQVMFGAIRYLAEGIGNLRSGE